MAKQLDNFPDDQAPETKRRYPWPEWTNGRPWEICQGEDYDVATENMRVNLHMKADSLGRKVRTKKISDKDGEGLIFQFVDSEEEELMKTMEQQSPEATAEAVEALYADALNIYERAREEVTIERKDGTRQKYAANRFKQQIDKGRAEGTLVPTIARIVRKPTLGFGHLEAAGRHDLMLENLVIDREKPYHHLFSAQSIVRSGRKRNWHLWAGERGAPP
jgi:hypothetical protein